MSKRLRVLIVEDSEDDTLLLVRELRKGGYEISYERIETLESMKAALEQQWDLVIADYVLPVFSGLTALKLLKERSIDVPFIILSGNIGEDIAIDAMKAGAHDYIIKSHMKRLIPAVKRELHEAEVRRERRRAEKDLIDERQRFYDVLEMLPVYVVLLTPDYHVPFANRFFRERFGESHGKRCFEYLFGRSEPCETCETYTVFKTNAPHHGEWTGPDGRNYDIFDYPFNDTDGSPLIMEMGIDITERKRAEAALKEANETLEQHVAERTVALSESEARFKLLSETAERLLETDDPQGIVNKLCLDVMANLDCQVFLNFLLDEVSGRLRLNAYAGLSEEGVNKIKWLNYGVGISGCVARDGVPIVSENIPNTPDPRTELIKFYGIQAYACHPLMVQGRLIGTLSFGTKSRPHFFLEELALIRTVTDQVATAIERMRLIKDLQRSRDELDQRVQERTVELAQANEELRQLSSKILSAQEEERKRIAGDIHDSLGSLLSQTKFMVEGAIEKIKGRVGPDGIEPLKMIILVIQESVNECRRLQMDLRPAMLDDLGILATLSWFCRRFETSYPGIRIDQKIDVQEDEVQDTLRTSIFRITQEAMNNIAKHSKADLVWLSLRRIDNDVELTIQDNGQGFDWAKVHSLESTKRGLGLSSMRERTELSGGAFAIESSEGKGTTIRASWRIS